jgi:cyclopropane fatty-acyl-phospholipid synthase-like methyltransferase
MAEHGIKRVEDVLDQASGFWRTAIVQAALNLQIASHLADGPRTAEDIAKAENADARAMGVVLDALCGMGLLEKADGRYLLHPLVAQLMPSLGQVSPLAFDPHAFDTWMRLPDVVRSGQPDAPGDSYWRNYALATREYARVQGTLAAHLLNIAPGGRVLDVGCGSGGIGYGVALRRPDVMVTALDVPTILPIAHNYANALGIEHRVKLLPVDIEAADSFGTREFDAAILGNILHLFDATTSRRILHKVAAALVPGGTVLINEILADDERRNSTYALMFGVELLLRTSRGTAHTFADLADWLSQAQFENMHCHSTTAYVSCITATRSVTEPAASRWPPVEMAAGLDYW